MLKVLLLAALCLVGSSPAVAASLIRIHRGTGDLAVVFVHGLAGSAASSFVNPDTGVRWFDLVRAEGPLDALGRNGASMHIYAIDYSDAFDGEVGIDEIATQITGRRDFRRLFQDHNHVWFVAHSMGGLVLKRILVLLQQRQQQRYLNRVLGAAFLGVPAEGAALANLAQGVNGLGEFGRWWLGVDWSQVNDLRTVDAGNSFLGQLQGDWGELVEARQTSGHPFHVPCAYETQPEVATLGIEITVVERLYASSTCSGRPFPIVEKHTMLPKPRDADDPSHDWMMGALEEALGQLDRATIVGRDRDLPFGSLLDAIEAEHRWHDQRTGLPGADETLQRASDDVDRLQLRNRAYTAPSYARLLERIADDHICLTVKVGPRRRAVSLALGEVVDCGAGNRLACQAVDCN